MELIKDLKDRGIFKDITNIEKFNKLKKNDGVYIGFDPSASSLHLGNFIQIATLLRFAQAGFTPIAVLGGATGMIGDPSGKNAERNLLSVDELNANKKKIRLQLEKFGFKVVDNFDFYKEMNVLDFLRNVGKHINVNYMINKDVVKSRLETGISFTEFTYQLIQAWDFKTLYEHYNVKVQVGGSDQWGNITSGVELIRKIIGDENSAVGITTELLTTKSGKKFGKSEGNAIWIDPELTSPFQLYQYLLNTTDEDLKQIFSWTTLIKLEEIDSIVRTHQMHPSKRYGQRRLAFEIVKIIHSEEDAITVEKQTDVLFGKIEVSELTSEQMDSLDKAIPTYEQVKDENILDLLIRIGAANSKREAREFIASKAIEINSEITEDENFVFNPKSFHKHSVLLKKGKKSFYLLKGK